ncbi:MAG TPA: phage portal protein [Phycisphaerae bacterium]|nr:phage portal protein [Phycisphaerae bacterium]
MAKAIKKSRSNKARKAKAPEPVAAARPSLWIAGTHESTVPRTIAMPMHASRDPHTGGLTLAMGSGFDVAGSDRTRRTRSYTVGGADRHLDTSKLSKVREIARDLDRNSCLIHGLMDRFCHNVVGDTFGFRPETADDGWNDAAFEWMIEQQGPDCDVRGLFDWHSILSTALRAIGTDGDVLLAHNTGRKIQPIEAHQIATPSDRKDETIVSGVRVDKAGKPMGFYVGAESYNGTFPWRADYSYVPAGDCTWAGYRTRFTQTRGIPVLAAALKHYDRVDAYIDNESLAAEIDACLAFFVQSDSDYDGTTLPPDMHEETDTLGDGSNTTETLQKIEPGMIAHIRRGETVQPFGAKRPGNQFEPYLVTSLRIVGAALGYPLELVLLDFSKTNYSSARAALLQAYRMFRVWQQWLIRTICLPIYRRWMAQGIAAGELSSRTDALKVKWFPPSWAWVDPLKEILALKEAVALGTSTITDEVERQGHTMPQHLTEREAEIKEMEARDIPSTGMVGAAVTGSTDPYRVATQDDEPPGDRP